MFANFNELTIKDGEGFSVPNYGGPLAVKFNTLAYTDTVAKSLFTLPKGAIPVAWLVNVGTAFNSSGTDLLDLGTSADPDAFANDLDLSATGQIPNGFIPGALFTALTEDTTVKGVFNQSVADASAGAAVVGCIYMLI